MRVKTIANIAWVLSFVTFIGVGAAIYLASAQNAVASKKSALVTDLVRALGEKRLLVDSYLRFHEYEHAIEWQVLHEASVIMLQSDAFATPEEHAILEGIREANAGMRQYFASLVALHDRELAGVVNPVEAKAQEHGALIPFDALSASATSGAYRLQEINDLKRAQARGVTNTVTMFGLALLSAMGMANIAILSVRVVRPLTKLRDATRVIAGGNFLYRTGITTKDEIGALGESFDDMAKNLEQLQSALEAKMHDMRLVMAAIPVGIIYFDQNLRYRFCNSLYASWLGRTVDSIVGKTVREVVGEEYYARIHAGVTAALAGKHVSFYPRLEYADKERDVHVEVIPDVEAGKIRGCTVVLTDVSSVVAAQEQLEAAKAAADEANNAKSAFLASVSHEIRTPVGVMLGYAEIMASEAETPAARGAAEVILRNGRNLLAILNDVLDLSKVEAGRLDIERRRLELGPLVHEVVELLRLKADEKNLHLEVDVRGFVPATIETDEVRLRQILTNLIGNAIKFTSKGGVTVTLSTTASPSQLLEVRVADTGLGIAEANFGRIFDPFTQAETYITRRFGGTGLGLPLSRELARALGGDVVLESSKIGVGSVFLIHIDMGSVDQSGPALTRAGIRSPSKKEPSVPRTGELAGLNLLLVEDGTDMQILLRTLLVSQGAIVDVAGDGEAGVAHAMKNRYDVVLMDIQMPVMDGYNAVKKLRSLRYLRPVVALTAHAMTGEAERCIAAGFDDYLTKPVDRQRLYAMVKKHVAGGDAKVASTSAV